MCIVLVYLNYYFGGVEIVGNWLFVWVVYLVGYFQDVGFIDIYFIDVMINDMLDDELRKCLCELVLDVIGIIVIMLFIYVVEQVLKIV